MGQVCHSRKSRNPEIPLRAGPDSGLSPENSQELIDFCADLGGQVMVFGSPKGRSAEGKISVEEAKRNFAEGLGKMADHARERGVTI